MGLLYHYTSPGAALSILWNKVLWFSGCEFMNDPEKIAYCHRLYDEAWAEVCLEEGVPEEQINWRITIWANPYECKSPISEEFAFSVPARRYSSILRAFAWAGFLGCAERDSNNASERVGLRGKRYDEVAYQFWLPACFGRGSGRSAKNVLAQS